MTGPRPPMDTAGGSYPHDYEYDHGYGYGFDDEYGYQRQRQREREREYEREYRHEYGNGPAGNGRENGYETGPHSGLQAGLEHAGAAGNSPAESAYWYDDEAGPLVRLYALTRGRARSDPRVFNLLTLIIAESGPYDDPTLGPEQVRVLELCNHAPQSVAEIAACCDLPLGIARVLLGDLLEIGHIRVRQPKPPAVLFDERILQEVINGLRAL